MVFIGFAKAFDLVDHTILLPGAISKDSSIAL